MVYLLITYVDGHLVDQFIRYVKPLNGYDDDELGRQDKNSPPYGVLSMSIYVSSIVRLP